MPEGNVEVVTTPQGGPESTTPPSNPSTTPSASPTPAPAPVAGGQQDDARQRGILADLQRERKARQEFETRVARAEAELAAERKRVQALAGVTPQSSEDQEIEQVRQQFAKVFPGLAKLSDEQIEKLLENANRADSLQETVAHHWQAHGRTMLDGVIGHISEAVGGDLSERQVRAITQAYLAEAESNQEFLARHYKGDKTLLAEFAKQWVDDWYEPARRRVTADAVNQNRRVPSGRDRTVQTTPPKAIDYKNPKAVEDAMVESFRSHGGRFEN